MITLPQPIRSQWVAPASKPKGLQIITRLEWIVAALLSLVAFLLLLVRALHAGALWRDECGALAMARLPTFTDILRNFPHEAFPLLFPTLIRGYTGIVGTSDAALRGFGLTIGMMFIAALWLNARLNGRGVPLLSLPLIGLNTSFLIWGTSIRGYGLGSVLIILAFALTGKMIILGLKPHRFALALLACLAAVQCLLYNSALLLVIGLAGIAVCLLDRNRKEAGAILLLGLLSAFSLLPYIKPYADARAWNVVVNAPTTPLSLYNQFVIALGPPVMALAWAIFFATLVSLAMWRLRLSWQDEFVPLLRFALFVSIGSVVAYYGFLLNLSYFTRTWYYLALIALLGAALDLLADILCSIPWLRVVRLAFASLALVLLPIADWPQVTQRQTSIDLVASQVESLAAPDDLIVVTPWQYGVSFAHYYHGTTPWITLPMLSDHRIHRYDLLKAKMTSLHPIDDALAAIGDKLQSAHRVWFVGGLKLPPPGRSAICLPPAHSGFSWSNTDYMESWMEQTGAFVRAHVTNGGMVGLPSAGAVNELENIPLFFVQGWRN